MPMKSHDLRKCLISKCQCHTREGSKHERYDIIIDGVTLATTTMSRGHTELGDALVSMVARQLHLNKQDLEKLVECTLSRDEYVQRLQNENGS
jgi:hypothetical protein